MPFNSSGVFTRAFRWVDDKAAGIDISPTRFDKECDGFADGLSKMLLKDGTQIVTGDIPMNGKKLTNVGTPTQSGDCMTYNDLATTGSPGVSQFATNSEVRSGSGQTRVISPSAMPVVITSEGNVSGTNYTIPLAAGYRWHDIRLDIYSSVASSDIFGRYISGGAAIVTPLYNYAFNGRITNSTADAFQGAAVTGVMLMTITNLYHNTARIRIPAPDATTFKIALAETSWMRADGHTAAMHGTFNHVSNLSFSGLNIATVSGVILGTYKVYSWR